jgi:hypothetical protein
MACKNTRLKRLATGKCFSCGDMRDSTRINCPKCRQKQGQAAIKRRIVRHTNGLCVICGDVSVIGARRCKKHWFQSIASSNLKTTRFASALEDLFLSQGGQCAYTNKKLTPGINASLDHKIPKSRGGTNELSNLQWIDEQINRMKNDMTHEEFIAFCIMIAKQAPMATSGCARQHGPQLQTSPLRAG